MKSLIAAFCLLASTTVFAKSLQGTYVLTQDCAVYDGKANPVLPAGTIEVLENVSTRDNSIDQPYAAILFQANGAAESILKLGIGRVTPFAYGPEAFTEGKYVADTFFMEEGYSPTDLSSRITVSAGPTRMIIKSMAGGLWSTCELQRKP